MTLPLPDDILHATKMAEVLAQGGVMDWQDLMEYPADTVAIVRHPRRHPALGRRAKQILAEADQG